MNNAYKETNSSGLNDLRKNAAAMASNAQNFIKETKNNVADAACEGTKFIKAEGKKNIKRAEGYVKAHPRKSTMYALGLGALASYFLLRRK